MKKVELLCPVGNYKRLKIAINYGADAVYLAGKRFGLRAGADNFSKAELARAAKFVHTAGKKMYVTLNIVAHEDDLKQLPPYVKYLQKIGVDAVIVSDLGVALVVKENSSIPIHVSTQANVLNSGAAKVWQSLGATRIVLARETSIVEIKKIHKKLPKMELEAFVHGAMCIAHSGRCLLSNVFTGRDANKGECVQACRFAYDLVRSNQPDQAYPIEEDVHGTYILNSKDMCLIEHLKELADSGVCSFKIEGRMKSDYYVANITNAYRRTIDALNKNQLPPFDMVEETKKSSHREYTTGFYFGDNHKTNLKSSGTVQTHDVVAEVTKPIGKNQALVSQRNKFVVGDVVEVLSPTENFLKTFEITQILTPDGLQKEAAKAAQEEVIINCPFRLAAGDMLRKAKNMQK